MLKPGQCRSPRCRRTQAGAFGAALRRLLLPTGLSRALSGCGPREGGVCHREGHLECAVDRHMLRCEGELWSDKGETFLETRTRSCWCDENQEYEIEVACVQAG